MVKSVLIGNFPVLGSCIGIQEIKAMLTKTILLTATTLIFSISLVAQTVPTASDDKELQRKIQKQVLVYDLENRIREIGLAAPRAMARYRIAARLWSEGKDDIGRAEEFAVAAIDDLYKNRVEVPDVYFSNLSIATFALLDRHAPQTSKTLKSKYNVTATDEAGIQNQLLSNPGGERAAVNAAIRSMLAGESTGIQIPVLLSSLQQRNSPELSRLLDAFLAAEERSPGRLRVHKLKTLTPYFDNENVQAGSVARFGRIVVRRAQTASQQTFNDFDAWLDLLNQSFPLISSSVRDLVPDVEVLRAVLSSRISQQSRMDRERNERINNSIDKLGTIIKEAEEAEDPLVKYDLYRRAAKLALERGLFQRSAELAVEFGRVDVSAISILAEAQKSGVGQMLEAVTEKALKANDETSALYAIDRHVENVRRAEGYVRVADYFVKKGSMDEARATKEIALRSIPTIESLPRRASVYLTLIPITPKIDPTSVFEVNSLAARAINTIPSLNVEDKPKTENFEKHVTSLMIVGWNLLPMLKEYVKADRNGAVDLTSRIEKKEIKVFADLVMGVESLDAIATTQEAKMPESGNLQN